MDVQPTSTATSTSTARVSVTATITNTGLLAGAEVVQLYLGFPAAAGEPPRMLRGFEKVVLAPGQRKRVEFVLGGDATSTWDSGARRWAAVRGNFSVQLGSSSRDIRLQADVTL